MAYPYHEILFNKKKKQSANTHKRRRLISETACRAKEVRHRKVRTVWFNVYEALGKTHLIHSNKNQTLACLGGDRGIGWEGTEETLWVMEMPYILTGDMVMCVYIYICQNFSNCPIKMPAFYGTKFYTNKPYFTVSSLYISTLILSKYYEKYKIDAGMRNHVQSNSLIHYKSLTA